MGVDGKMECLMISGWVDVLRSAKLEWVSGQRRAWVKGGNSDEGGDDDFRVLALGDDAPPFSLG